LVKRENTDFTETERIKSGLDVLRITGCLRSLGEDFNQEGMRVPAAVRDRVVFVEKDALSFLVSGEYPSPDIYGDFF